MKSGRPLPQPPWTFPPPPLPGSPPVPASRRLPVLSWRRACCPVPGLLELNSVCDVVMFVSGLGQSQAASAACQPIRAVRGQVSLNSTSPRPAISYRRFCTVYTKKQVYAFYSVFISCIQCNRMSTFNLVPASADAKKTERLSVVLLRPFGPARHWYCNNKTLV